MKQNVLPVTIKHKGYQGDVSHRQKKLREAKINDFEQGFSVLGK